MDNVCWMCKQACFCLPGKDSKLWNLISGEQAQNTLGMIIIHVIVKAGLQFSTLILWTLLEFNPDPKPWWGTHFNWQCLLKMQTRLYLLTFKGLWFEEYLLYGNEKDTLGKEMIHVTINACVHFSTRFYSIHIINISNFVLNLICSL